jgi:hypothetical protein
MIRPIRQIILTAAALACLPLAGAENLSPKPAGPRARVVSVRNPAATHAFKADAMLVEEMVNRGITNFTAKPTVAAAWADIVSTNDIVGIKVYTATGPETGTRPQVAAAVVRGLLAAGIPASHIIVWDRREADLRKAGFFQLAKTFGIRAAGAAEAGYDEKTHYEAAMVGNLVYGDLEFGRKEEGVGRRSFVSKLVSRQMTKIINIAPVLNHNGAGVAGNLCSLALGSVDNTWRFEISPVRLATAIPELYALPALGDRVVLNISDALVCQYEGSQRELLHYSVALNEIRLSRDPVALDVLALQDLELRRSSDMPGQLAANRELYKNAELLELGVADLKRIEVTTLATP